MQTLAPMLGRQDPNIQISRAINPATIAHLFSPFTKAKKKATPHAIAATPYTIVKSIIGYVAGELGFEPRFRVPKTRVRPLDDSPMSSLLLYPLYSKSLEEAELSFSLVICGTPERTRTSNTVGRNHVL